MMILKHSDRIRELGGPGSGNFGHAGRPGERGGSQKGSGEGVGYSSHSDIISDPDAHNKSVDFSELERKSLDSYKGSGYSDINKALFKGDSSNKSISNEIKNIESAIDKCSISGGEFYSGLGESGAAMFESMNEGDTFEYSGFLSTSTRQATAESSMGSKNSMVLLTAKKGDKAYSFGSKDPEQEVLFNRGQKMKLSKISTAERRYYDTGKRYTMKIYHVETL